MSRRIDPDDLTTLIGLAIILSPLIIICAGFAVVAIVEAWRG